MVFSSFNLIELHLFCCKLHLISKELFLSCKIIKNVYKQICAKIPDTCQFFSKQNKQTTLPDNLFKQLVISLVNQSNSFFDNQDKTICFNQANLARNQQIVALKLPLIRDNFLSFLFCSCVVGNNLIRIINHRCWVSKT